MPAPDQDMALLVDALQEQGVDPRVTVWSDPAVDWAGFDLVVVRTPWDYTHRLPEFLEWAAAVPRLANPLEVLRWNTDKRYLRDLEAAGVPVVPTTFLAPGEPLVVPAGEFVVKPTVSAGARDTARCAAAEEARPLVERLHDAGRTVMVQPYLSAVDTRGETSVLSFGGEVSHGAVKAAMLDLGAGARVLDSREFISPREPSAAELEVAAAAVAVAPGELLYSRVDLVPGPDGEPVVLELELTEPSLFLRHAPGSAERFARAVLQAVG